MYELKFRDDKKAMKRLAKACGAVDKFLERHKSDLNDREHRKLRKLMIKRGSALSDATGLDIHTIGE